MEITTNGRDTHGRFGTGNGFGKGRPLHANKLAYIAVTEGVVTPERWRKIVERAANDAESGTGRDVASAREFLAKYVLPLPQRLEVFLQQHEFKRAKYEGKTILEMSDEEAEEAFKLMGAGTHTLRDNVLVSMKDPRYREELHQERLVWMTEQIQNGDFQETLEEIGFRLEPLGNEVTGATMPVLISGAQVLALPSETRTECEGLAIVTDSTNCTQRP